MPLGTVSKIRLSQCDTRLQQLITAVAAGVDSGECHLVNDITVLCGFRNEADQNAAFERGTSKLRWPHSKHNSRPARAVDIAPYPVNWLNTAAFKTLREYVLKKAAELKLPVRTIEWDLPHYEI